MPPKPTQLCIVTAVLFSLLAWPCFAQRPVAIRMLPDSTVACVRIANFRELIEKFRETSIGRMLKDDKVRPLVQQLYGSAIEAFSGIQDRVGLPLNEILTLPQGEICFAVVAAEQTTPAGVLFLEVGDQLPAWQKLIARGEEELVAQGGNRSTETAAGVTLVHLDPPRAPFRLTHFQRDGVAVVCTNADLAKEILAIWNGDRKDAKTLEDNRRYTTILSRCSGAQGEIPQVTWYLDPIELVTRATRGNFAAQLALSIIPTLGLDGFKGIGGSLIYGGEEFEVVSHMHVMLSSPRQAVLKMVAFSRGELAPDPFVPHDVATYMTVHWDARQTFEALTEVIDKIRGDGVLAAEIEQRISKPLGVDFQKELLAQLQGRATYCTWIEKPIRLNSQSSLVGIQLKEPAKFAKTLESITGKFPNQITHESYLGITRYRAKVGGNERVDEQAMRRPELNFGIIDEHLVLSDSPVLFEMALSCAKGASKRLEGELDYKLIASKISRQPGGDKPGLISFQRPEEALRSFYELATNQELRARLSRQAETNRLLRSLDEALKQNPLPPFADLTKYLAPGGGLMVDDASGLHYTSFGLRRK